MDRLLHRPLTRRRFIGVSAATAAALAAAGCVPGAPQFEPGGAPRAPLSRSAAATVHVAAAGGRNENTRVAPIPGGQRETVPITSVPLSLYDHDGNVVPGLAERLPSFEDGTWVVNQDGTMRLTWPLRRNVKWHDGRPFTARDVLFSWEFQTDTSLPWEPRPFLRNVSAIDAPDDYTIVTHYKVSSAFANAVPLQDFIIFPAHVLRPLWEAGEGERIFGHDLFREGFVGLGAYRMERWNPDDTIVLKPFEDFSSARQRSGPSSRIAIPTRRRSSRRCSRTRFR